VTFFGVSTLLFQAGDAAVITDGFFTRPNKLALLKRLEPDRELIARCLRSAGVERLDSVLVLHSHYDHALDSVTVAQLTGARLVGSQSTSMIGLGSEFPPERIDVIQDGTVTRAGTFKINWLVSRHAAPLRIKGNIEEPLKPRAWVTKYREGGSYSVLIEQGEKSLLVHATAGFIPGALRGRHADVVLLGVGGLGKKDKDYREAYWREVVEAVSPERVIPIHWDDFWQPVEQPLIPMPPQLDDFDETMKFLLERGEQSGIEVKILPAWVKVYPFRSA
jgi:L-ascorbate metabolism protein UlaG (beta-lactamase superfamily)